MNSAGKFSFLLPQPVFAVPPERLIGFARLALTLFLLIAVSFDPPQSVRDAQFTYIVAEAYFAFAILGAMLVMWRPLGPKAQLAVHAVDTVCVGLLMYFNQGPASPYFVFFTFILLSATLQWDWRGAIGSTVLLVLLLMLLLVTEREPLSTEGDELNRAIFRPVYLMVAGLMLGYVGAFQERSRIRLAKLVAWPGPDYDRGEPVPIASALAHAAEIMRVPRVLIVWEQPNEPYRDVALWSKRGLEYSRVRSDRFGTLVAPDATGRSFTYRPTRRGAEAGEMINADLRQTYAIRSAFTAPFHLPVCTGRIFLLDRVETGGDDLLLAELIATRIGVDLEHHLLRGEREAAAALSERSRLARDLHDGVLQGLAAANIQLKISSAQAEKAVADQLSQTRQLLTAEQQRIRTYIEDTRSGAGVRSEKIDLAEEVTKLLRNLGAYWRCEIDVAIDPPHLQVAEDKVRNVRHLLAEAVSNAVRHGRASRLNVSVRAVAERLYIRICDNGSGFPDLAGTFTDEELEARNLGPVSLRTRARDLGGSLILHSSSSGAEIHVEIPL